MIDWRTGLSIVVLIFYAIGLLPTVSICVCHGIGRHASWLYLLTFAIIRIAGVLCEIAAEQNQNLELYTAAAICNGIGVAPLLLALMGMLKRTNDGMPTHLTVRVFQLMHMITLVGLALSITGGVESIPTNSSAEISTGIVYRQVGAVLVLVVYVANAGIVVIILPLLSKAWDGDRKLVCAAAASLPFLLVRVVYMTCMAFAYQSSTFNTVAPDIEAQAFMQIVMEFIVWSLYVAAGLASPSTRDAPHSTGRGFEIWSTGNTSQDARSQPQ